MKTFTHDLYAALSHIPELGPDYRTRAPGVAGWIPDDDTRRLTAYRVLSAMRDNARRYWLPSPLWDETTVTDAQSGRVLPSSAAPASKVREYGHARLLVETARALVLGDGQTITLPSLDGTDADDPALERQRAARDWLEAWATREMLPAKLLDVEEHAIGDGDGILTLGWSGDPTAPASRRRLRLRSYDPGFWFPDLTSRDSTPGWDDDWPPVVHLAWEWTDDTNVIWARRLTWRIVPANIPIVYPWSAEPSPWSCTYEACEWRTDRIKAGDTVYTLAPDGPGARVITAPVDLGIDFMPVIHVPMDYPGERFYGRSLLMSVAQVLDDLAGSDTDNAVTSELIASPPTVITGAPGGALGGGPGAQWNLPDGAGASLLDTSKALVAGHQHNERLITTLAACSRLTKALLGREVPSEVPSGLALDLGMAPARQLIRDARMVRDVKHRLLLRMVMRMAQSASLLDRGETPEALVALGAALPTDLAGLVELVAKLLPAHGISTDTAVRVLRGGGLPVEDPEAEVARIHAEDTEGAVRIVDATGDTAAAAARLGITPPVPAPEPEPATE